MWEDKSIDEKTNSSGGSVFFKREPDSQSSNTYSFFDELKWEDVDKKSSLVNLEKYDPAVKAQKTNDTLLGNLDPMKAQEEFDEIRRDYLKLLKEAAPPLKEPPFPPISVEA